MIDTQFVFKVSFELYTLGAVIAVMLNNRMRSCTILSYGCSVIASVFGIAGGFSVILSGPLILKLPVIIPITELSIFIDGIFAFFMVVGIGFISFSTANITYFEKKGNAECRKK